RPRVTRQPVDHRVAAVGSRFVRRRQPDGGAPRRRVTQRIADQRPALDDLDGGAHRFNPGASAQLGERNFISAPNRWATVPDISDGFSGRRGWPAQATSTDTGSSTSWWV